MKNLRISTVLFAAAVFSLLPLRLCAETTVRPSGFFKPHAMAEYDDPAYVAVQDSSGYVWIGTQTGLLRYDGCHVVRYQYSPEDPNSLCNSHVSSLLYCPDAGKMIIGTDAGVSVYDFLRDDFSTVSACGYLQVKALLRDADTLYVGTVDGILRFNLPDGSIGAGMQPDTAFVVNDHIACIRKTGRNISFGAYDCFYTYDAISGKVEKFSLGTERKLVLDIFAEDGGRFYWLGTEQGLVRYDTESRKSDVIIGNIPVKNFFRNTDGRLWIGTDNGLYIKDADGLGRYRHESENDNSLPDNVVWSISRGKGGDIFICTDVGLAIPEIPKYGFFRPLSSMTGSREGLNISSMAVDSSGNLCFGGMNGLVMYRKDNENVRWYKSDRGNLGMRIAHNKIRDLYDDGKGLFAVSDGGLDRIDHRTGMVRHFDIMAPDGEHIITWMYSMAEDACGRLWIGTFDGLLMIENKDLLLAARSGQYRSDRLFNLSSSPGISGNVVMEVVFADTFGAVLTNGNVDIIGLSDGNPTISYVDLPAGLYATTLASDDGRIWIGTSRGLFSLSGNGRAIQTAGFGLNVDAIVPDDDRVIVLSGKNIYVLDIAAGTWSHYPFGNSSLFCGIAGEAGTVYLGSTDGYFEFRPDALPEAPGQSPVSVTSLFIGNERVEVGREYDGNIILPVNLSELSGIVLKHDQNSFSVEYSSFDFTGRNARFAYRLKGLDDSWQETADSRAVFINVPGGKYCFEVAAAMPDGSMPVSVASLPVRVRTVWYMTPYAYIMYFLIFAGLCTWVFYYLRMRHQLQIEHMERDRALKSADMKTEFLSNVSHEFKSPLSIILGFVSRMIASESDAMRTRELNTVRQNAEKMHLLLDRMVQFNEDSGSASLFIPSAVSLQEMAREVYDRYAEPFARKNVNARFVADEIGYIFMVDKVKMETVLSNLLSNALKFTPSGGSILMSVSVGEETEDMLYADIRVADTGCGIAEDELPLVFNRYYRAPSGQKDNPGGSGIGLALVREIVEQHKGKVWATSELGKGTSFTVRLSTMKADSFVLKSDGKEEVSLHSLSNVWQHDRKPIILLVEDNADIRDFITASLGKDYVFLSAGDGRQGLDIVSKEKVDLVITDIAMPGMDGLAMSRAIRNSLETTFLPIIILTGKNDERTELKSFEYADAFIAKPFNLNYLNNRIIQLLIKHEQYLAKVRQQKILEPSEVEPGRSYDEELLRNVVDIVAKHLEDPDFSAASLCAESRYGSKQVYRKIKQLTGLSIVEFIRDTRLQKAAQYLSQGKLSVTEVMYKVGFTTASYFSKCFKEKFGVPPSEYK